MSIVKVPVNQEAAIFQFSIELDGLTYGMLFRWNERSGQWALDLLDGEGNALVTGIRCVINVPLLANYHGRDGVPAGELLFVDTSGQDVDADFEDLGRRVLLYYASEGELA